MDRNNIEKIAHTPEDKVLLAKVWDKINAGMRKNIPASTGFLTPREQQMCQYLFGDVSGLRFFGGYPDAERQMLVYLPEYLDESELTGPDSPLSCIRCSFYDGDVLTHRDLLGALMGAGIARETVGDICVGKDSCDFLVTAQIAPYILQSITSAGRAKLRLTQIPVDEIRVPEVSVREIRDTLASLRLDCVVAAGFRIGRSLAAQQICAGKVAVDGLPCEKPDKLVFENCKISLRGSGKIRLVSIGNKSKKDRVFVTIHRYL